MLMMRSVNGKNSRYCFRNDGDKSCGAVHMQNKMEDSNVRQKKGTDVRAYGSDRSGGRL